MGGRLDLVNIYETPRIVTDINECDFYHTMDIPGYGHVEGWWDLREATRDYLGGVNFKGKRVLEIGPASGFLSFYMESQGAEVICSDLSENESWDVVPFSRVDYNQAVLNRKAHLRRLNNSFWLCHKAYGSKAKVVYCSVYEIPDEIGAVDITVVSSVLLHLRDPFYALQQVARLTKETLIVTEVVPIRYLPLIGFAELLGKVGLRVPLMIFVPYFKTCRIDTWWFSTPTIVKHFMEVLGFEKHEAKFHFKARYRRHRSLLYTVVGYRTNDFSL